MKLMAKPNLFCLTIFAIFITLRLSFIPHPLRAQSAIPETPFSSAALGNATYRNVYSEAGQVTLENGQVEDETNRFFVSLTGYVAYGDLTGDEVDDAAVVLVTNSGGTGNFYDLAVVVDDNGVLTNVATTLLGDRIELHDLDIVDGQIIVDLITQGPDDAACCPTLPVQRSYTLANDSLSMIAEETKLPVAATTGVFSPDAAATVATLNLGGVNFWLDPMLVSLHGGAVTGPAVRANTLGQGCAGTIDERPDVVLNWSEDEAVATLRIFLLSMGDPSLVVVTPTGEIICNDDLNPLMLDPYLEVIHPQPGRYAIYLGSFEGEVTTPGFLVVTSQELSPATLDLAQLFPRTVNPGAVVAPQPLDVLALAGEPLAALDEPLTGTMPYTVTAVAGGELGAYAIELGNDLCTGFIAATPTFAFDWAGDSEQLALFFEAAADTTLVVRDPNGDFQCNDDVDDDANLNPYLELTPIAGRYTLWVGSFAPSTLLTGTLTVAGDADLRPTPLTSAMVETAGTGGVANGAAGTLPLGSLRNATYSGIYDAPVTLIDGVYEEGDPPLRVQYRDNATLFGDLDGDGVDDAVVFLTDSGGGSATFTYMAAQLNQHGQPVDGGSVMLEDRTQFRMATIQDGQVELEFTTAGPGDGACCPSHMVHKTYALQDGKLAEIAGDAAEPVRVSAADLDGTSWRLVELGANEPVADDIAITISFAGDQISGKGACNNYTGSFTLSDDNPFLVTFGPLAVTRMICPAPASTQETAYFSALAAATIWGYDFGDLVISYGSGDERKLLHFTAQPSAEVEAATTELLIGSTWQWIRLTDPTQQVMIDAPESYTLTFLDDVSLQIQADCNRATAAYTATDDGSFTVMPGITTLALCGPESRSEELLQKLGFAARYFFQDGHLFIDLMADGGTLEFRP